MSSPLPYLVRMLLFLAAVVGLAYVLHEDLLRVFLNTPILDSVILGVLLIGIFFVFRQVISLWPEVQLAAPLPAPRGKARRRRRRSSINLLAPMAAMLGERQDHFRLSPTATRAVLDGIATRLDERRELARYMIGLLIFLGLLGTFWGLLETIGAVADAINGLQVTGGDAVQMFAKLKDSIEGPLKGMSTAFGASLFGLSGSLVLGFLELQASQAQGRFHIELEEWLAGATRLSSGAPGRRRTGRAGLCRGAARAHRRRPRRADAHAAARRGKPRGHGGRQRHLVERLAALAEAMRGQQTLLARAWPSSRSSCAARQACLPERPAGRRPRGAADAPARHRGHLARLVEENVRSRTALADELRGEFRLLARTIASTRGAGSRPAKARPMAAISRRRGGARRLYLAGLCRRADHASDGADLPAVAASASRSSRCRPR